MSATDDDLERAARLRAAFAYAKLTKPARAEALGVGVRHVTRYESGQTPVPPDRLDAVIAATGVPRWFLANGFAAAPEPEEPTIAERVEALEAQVKTLRQQSATRGAPAPGGELGRRLEGDPPNDEDRHEPDSDQGTGVRRGIGES